MNGSITETDGKGKIRLQQAQDMPTWSARNMAGREEMDDGSVHTEMQTEGRAVVTYVPMPHDV